MGNNTEVARIAIIGMAAHFLGADTLDRFWQNLRTGGNCVITLSNEELKSRGVNEGKFLPHQIIKST